MGTAHKKQQAILLNQTAESIIFMSAVLFLITTFIITYNLLQERGTHTNSSRISDLCGLLVLKLCFAVYLRLFVVSQITRSMRDLT